MAKNLPQSPLMLILILVGASLGLTIGCSGRAQQPSLIVASAASLAPAFEQLGPDFSQATGIEVVFSIASTGHLSQQLRNGAPFDVFASADAAHVDLLIDEGFLERESRLVFATGRLVLAVHTPSIAATLEDLRSEDIVRIAIANPQHAPYGIAARQVLERTGLWTDLESKIIYAESVQQATQLIASGTVQAGLVAASNAGESGLQSFELDGSLYDPIQHVAARSVEGPMRNQAQLFLAYLTSVESQGTLRANGLEPAGE